ncbi:MAG: hypothetical protein F6K18_05305 [Okeania sp. SIO2C2]|uniref:hypothetical protein n=1 Tax=Okeania sp. SIO2C2 TaxID=2607787 RepID=UPI0013BDB221|nr:hypothetical protein [Okeania sp. SIO2C2]NEP86285.1 hypothetical protein [Okeania sp. SIO2C2]
MGKVGERIEQINETFGIEVEFCTHDSEILSFTHIEVCTIKHKGNDWKIETDADYTLELVSPILTFDNAKEANQFKATLMATLDQLVREEPTLGKCVESIKGFLETQTNIKYFIEIKEEIKETRIKYILQTGLLKELNFHNWDEDTNLERVIAQRKKINTLDNEKVQEHLQGVMLSPSKKHGGLPSSQLNHPMSLNTYVWYSMYIKEPKAWFRVIASSKDDFLNRWRNKKIESIKTQYKHLDDNWKQRYLNDDYLEQRQDNNIPIWHRYWFWLVSIREILEKALNYRSEGEKIEELDKFKAKLLTTKIKEPISEAQLFWNKSKTPEWIENILFEDSGMKSNTVQDTKEISNDPSQLKSAMYVTIHKLISGALGVLSEEKQGELQEMIMAMQGEIDADVLKSCVANPEFLHFHYALKDLTPLWFKGSLGDVIFSINDTNIKLELKKSLEKLKSDDVEYILNNNLKFLGRIYMFNEYFNYGNSYDWEEFRETLLPSVSGFVRQFNKGKDQLVEEWDNINSNFTYEKIQEKRKNENIQDQENIQDEDHAKEKKPAFLNRTAVPAWEGRWDTIKKPIRQNGKTTEFLVEHRNN